MRSATGIVLVFCLTRRRVGPTALWSASSELAARAFVDYHAVRAPWSTGRLAWQRITSWRYIPL